MRSGRSRCASPAASSSTDSTSFSLAGQWAPASSCSLLLALLSSSAGSCCDCWFTGEFLSLPWHLFLLDVFYLDSRGGNCCRAEEDKDEKRPKQVGSACSLFLKRFDQLLPCWAVGTSFKLFASLGSPAPAGSCCDCWFTGEFLSLPWYLFLLDVFYLDSRGVIVVARWECARGLASGL